QSNAEFDVRKKEGEKDIPQQARSEKLSKSFCDLTLPDPEKLLTTLSTTCPPW
ncbi:hypothetical protein AVEN_18316-2-1, partial [Araneus ventricosus]